ncbi:MAG: CpaF family protein [Agromyces sp.]
MPDAVNHIAAGLISQHLQASDVTLDRVEREVRAYTERALAGGVQPLVDERGAAHDVLASLTGYGELQAVLDDPEVEEVWINRPDAIFVARNGVPQKLSLVLRNEDVRLIVERMLSQTGRRVDLSQPFVDASLPDGSRLHVVIPDITREYWSVNIRKFHARIKTLDALVNRKMLTHSAADFLAVSMLAGLNILVSGPTHAGKTTLLNALIAAGRPTDRIVTIEETFELASHSADTVAMQSRPANLEGAGEVSLRRLVKESLRMRPDRLVVGEVREAESLDLLIALNSGVPGLATIHANSARDALVKLCTLPLLAGRNIDSRFVIPTVAAVIDLVVHCRRDVEGHRTVSEIIAPSGGFQNDAIESSILFRAGGANGSTLQATGVLPVRTEKFDAIGVKLPQILGAA